MYPLGFQSLGDIQNIMDGPNKKLGQVNPFNITKAVDFSDQEIENYWVDIADDGNGFLEMAKPTSPMPMLILGGKGSGKTHLMRYLSYQLQKIRHKQDIITGIHKERFLGIYFRCGGLNAARFSGKGIGEDIWESIFAYYMELWLAQLVLEIIVDAFSDKDEFTENESKICSDIVNLFDSPEFDRPQSIKGLIETLHLLQKKVNTAVNNSSITRNVDIKILATSGILTFGVPKVLALNLTSLKAIQFLYLVDEFENLAEAQQKYINTLYREKEIPCSFKIGARLYGVRTYKTFSAEEENKEGSEYEVLYLDASLRKTGKSYNEFAKRLCTRRLTESGYPSVDLDVVFEVFPTTKCIEELVNYVTSNKQEITRPYFHTLKKRLKQGLRSNAAIGVDSEDAIGRIITNLTVSEYPFLEKVNTFLFYRDWYSGENLIDASESIAQECKEFIEDLKDDSRHEQVLNHFRGDLIAQLVREYAHKQLYLGLDTFIEMSDGLPRNLLIILKHIFKWSVFNGEHPFYRGRKISIESQKKGIREASEWFYHDARMTGVNGEVVRASIDRLATLFREIRFSDKPSECSISAFSADTSQSSEQARGTIDLAEKWSLLIKIEGGQRDRNSKRVDLKYQINSMLAPRWDLPISRRGAIALRSEEVDAIFDPHFSDKFEQLVKERVDRMTAPFFGKSNNGSNKRSDLPIRLPGFEND